MRSLNDARAPEIRLHRRLRDLALSVPERIALIHEGMPTTYAALARDAEAASAWLWGKGIRPADWVAVSVADQYRHLLICLGLLRLGCPQVCLPTFEPEDALRSLVERMKPGWLLTGPRTRTLGAMAQVELADLSELRASAMPVDCALPDAAAPSMIVLTSSGTTGNAKLIPVTERNLFAGGHPQAAARPDVAHQRISIEHSFGKKRFLQSIFAGATIVSSDNGSIESIADVCARFGVNRLFLSAYAARQWLAVLARDGGSGPVCLDVELGLYGSKIPAEIVRALRERVSPRVGVIYGAQEVGMITRATSEDLERSPDSVGRPVSGVELQVVDDQFRPLPIGAQGLVGIRSPGCVDRYLFDDALSARMFRDGWFFPGDIGELTPDGELIFAGRADDAIIMNSINIFPSEIEQVALRCPGVDDAVVFPLKSRIHDAIPVLAYASASGVEPGAVVEFCRPLLGIRSPRKAFRVTAVPRNPDGKVLRAKLRQLVGVDPEDSRA